MSALPIVAQAYRDANPGLAPATLYQRLAFLKAACRHAWRRGICPVDHTGKMDLPTAEANLERIRKEFPDDVIVPISAEAELTLRNAAKAGLIDYLPGDDFYELKGNVSEQQKKALEYIKKNVLDKYKGTGAQKVLNTAVFDHLKYIAVFPGGVNKLADKDGNVLPDCFLLPPDSTALDFAAKVHTDLAKNFVAAIDAKSKRKIGRDTELKHRDVIEIMTSK